MALGSHLITVRRLEKYINDVIGKKANLPDTSKTIIGNISQINSDLTQEVSRATSQENVLSARIDRIASLPSGSTSGDAELMDIRVGANGTTYPTAGDAVRGQVTDLSTFESELVPFFTEKNIELYAKWTNGKYIDPNSGVEAVNASYSCTSFLSITEGKSYNLRGRANLYGAYYDESKAFIEGIMYQGSALINTNITAPTSAKYLRLSLQTENISTLHLSINDDVYLSDNVMVHSSNVVNEHILTVATNGTKQYTSLRDAIKACTNSGPHNKYIIEFYGNWDEYDISNDFTAQESADPTFIGVTVPSFVKIRGIGDRTRNIISLRLQEENSVISTLNINSATELENLTIIGEKTKYAVHDDFHDFQNTWIERHICNCRFIGITTSSVRAYGAGYFGGYNWHFDNCTFENRSDKYGLGYGPFSAHNNIGMIGNANLYFRNCRFKPDTGTTGCTFGSLNSYNGQTEENTNRLFFYGNSTEKIKMVEENASVYGSGIKTIISGFGNTAKNSDVIIVNTDGIDYSSYVDLI